MRCFGQAKEHKADAPIRRVFGSTTKKSFHSSKRVPADQNSEAIRFRSGLNSSWPEIGNWPRLNSGKKSHFDTTSREGALQEPGPVRDRRHRGRALGPEGEVRRGHGGGRRRPPTSSGRPSTWASWPARRQTSRLSSWTSPRLRSRRRRSASCSRGSTRRSRREGHPTS